MERSDAGVNSKGYWDKRFGSGDWEARGGYSQTRLFAESQIQHLKIPKNFSGSICDFGCGAGDAFPVYKQSFPHARLFGVDFSEDAIRLCVQRYGSIAEFHCGESIEAPSCDVIICSNVLEHIDNDRTVLQNLLGRCGVLYVVVPYDESPLSSEHVRRYGKESFSEFAPVSKKVFLSKGWSKYGVDLWYRVYVKNIGRFLLGRPLASQARQIVFEFKGTLQPGA